MTLVRSDTQGGGRSTVASLVYERLREDILQGKLAPGAKLTLQTLQELYEAGTSPIREALNRLSTEGLAVYSEQRGFRVATVSASELEELTRTRCWLNVIALPASIQNGDSAWEESIVLAFHRLSRAPLRLAGEPERLNPEWDLLHHRFHVALIAACRSQWLLRFHDQLFRAALRYQRLSTVHVPTRDVNEEHRAIMDAVLARNAEQAVAEANRHITYTADIIMRSLSGP